MNPKSSNPVFRSIDETQVSSNTASFLGITIKTGILLLSAVLATVFAKFLLENNPDALITILGVSAFVAFIAAMLGIFLPRFAAPFGILYAASEGFLLGTLTLLLDQVMPGIGLMAVTGTLVIFGVMLSLYSFRVIRATNRMRKFMFSFIIGILVFSLITLILSLTSPVFMQNFTSNPAIMIGVSLVLLAYGAFMLILDFDRAEQIVASGADKKYEWTVALGLMVTIFWIYLEVLKLLSYFLSRE